MESCHYCIHPDLSSSFFQTFIKRSCSVIPRASFDLSWCNTLLLSILCLCSRFHYLGTFNHNIVCWFIKILISITFISVHAPTLCHLISYRTSGLATFFITFQIFSCMYEMHETIIENTCTWCLVGYIIKCVIIGIHNLRIWNARFHCNMNLWFFPVLFFLVPPLVIRLVSYRASGWPFCMTET